MSDNITMIKCLAKKMQEELNEISTDRTFRILAETGERESLFFNEFEQREMSEIVNTVYGILYAEPSRLAPIPGITVLTVSAMLEIYVDAKRELQSEDGTYPEVERIRAIVEAYGREKNGDTFPYEAEGNKSFTVTVNYSPAVCGDWLQRPSDFGEVIPVRMSVYYTAVENGVSSNDVIIKIAEIPNDGSVPKNFLPLYFESCTFTRTKTVEPYTFNSSESIRNTVIQHGFGIDIVAPLLTGDLGKMIIDEIMNGSLNTPYRVRVEINDKKYNYTCVFGNCTGNVQPGKNVGVTISLVEART